MTQRVACGEPKFNFRDSMVVKLKIKGIVRREILGGLIHFNTGKTHLVMALVRLTDKAIYRS